MNGITLLCGRQRGSECSSTRITHLGLVTVWSNPRRLHAFPLFATQSPKTKNPRRPLPNTETRQSQHRKTLNFIVFRCRMARADTFRIMGLRVLGLGPWDLAHRFLSCQQGSISYLARKPNQDACSPAKEIHEPLTGRQP